MQPQLYLKLLKQKVKIKFKIKKDIKYEKIIFIIGSLFLLSVCEPINNTNSTTMENCSNINSATINNSNNNGTITIISNTKKQR